MNKKYSRYITGALILIMVFVAAIRMQNAASVGIDFNDTRIVITGPSGTELFPLTTGKSNQSRLSTTTTAAQKFPVYKTAVCITELFIMTYMVHMLSVLSRRFDLQSRSGLKMVLSFLTTNRKK